VCCGCHDQTCIGSVTVDIEVLNDFQMHGTPCYDCVCVTNVQEIEASGGPGSDKYILPVLHTCSPVLASLTYNAIWMLLLALTTFLRRNDHGVRDLVSRSVVPHDIHVNHPNPLVHRSETFTIAWSHGWYDLPNLAMPPSWSFICSIKACRFQHLKNPEASNT
jgi:hypothetical protein